MEKITTSRAEPTPVAKRINWDAVAADVVDAAGEWVRLDDLVNSSYAHHINKGNLRAFQPAGDFEAVVRNKNAVRPNCSELYIRYVGDAK